jgi:hypothetical protein
MKRSGGVGDGIPHPPPKSREVPNRYSHSMVDLKIGPLKRGSFGLVRKIMQKKSKVMVVEI